MSVVPGWIVMTRPLGRPPGPPIWLPTWAILVLAAVQLDWKVTFWVVSSEKRATAWNCIGRPTAVDQVAGETCTWSSTGPPSWLPASATGLSASSVGVGPASTGPAVSLTAGPASNVASPSWPSALWPPPSSQQP